MSGRTTYRRADGKPFQDQNGTSTHIEASYLADVKDILEPADFIEEEWVEGEVRGRMMLARARFRAVRLGHPEICPCCHGRGMMWGWDMLEKEYEFGCATCEETGFKLRNVDPPWTISNPAVGSEQGRSHV
jgi:hypothetical protein